MQPNRKNIDGAKLRWELETHQPETALPTDEDLFGETDTSNTNRIVPRAATTRSTPSMKNAHALRAVTKTKYWID